MTTAESTSYRVHTIKRRSKQKDEVKYGPPQLPPDQQAGTTFTEEMMRDFSKDSLGRDAFSVDSRLAEWVETEELYEKNRNAPLPVDTKLLHMPKYGIHLNGGDMGAGKTLWASYVARHFRRRGWNVFSTAGLLIGQRLSLIEAYSFPDKMTPGCYGFVDEVHTFVDRYSANAVRGRTFGQSSTAMRKEEMTVMGASAHTIMVGWEYKGVSECVMVPSLWYPRGKLKAPPFCHVGINMLYPFPYRRKDELLMDAGLVTKSSIRRAYWRPSPQDLMAAAKLMDSFESVKIGENFDINAKKMADQRSGDSGKGGLDLITVILRVWQAGYITQGRTFRFGSMREVLRRHNFPASLTDLRSALEIEGVPVSNDAVHEDDLRDYFVTQGHKTPEEIAELEGGE